MGENNYYGHYRREKETFMDFVSSPLATGRRHPNERTRRLPLRPLQRCSLSACVLMSTLVFNALFLICSCVQFSEQKKICAYPISDYLHDILNDSSEHPFAHATHCSCLWIRQSMRVVDQTIYSNQVSWILTHAEHRQIIYCALFLCLNLYGCFQK